MRKVAVEYVELCGIKNGGDSASSQNYNLKTLEAMVKELGIPKANLTRLLEIERKLTPEVLLIAIIS
ncbi:hypothetical protein [Clostridium beijerinckii]|uniref:hypothetical protein n=1 Tax=Clostridium beijerinckii TaxID=1520 RepID=UPI001F47D368|nr:hypothetical protein [Clostridium beijerinckii]